jgi:hypothetical protein
MSRSSLTHWRAGDDGGDERRDEMTKQEIDDLRGLCAASLTPDEHTQFLYFNGEVFTDHCLNDHPAAYEVCRDPLCQAGFEAEVLCDLYGRMNQ